MFLWIVTRSTRFSWPCTSVVTVMKVGSASDWPVAQNEHEDNSATRWMMLMHSLQESESYGRSIIHLMLWATIPDLLLNLWTNEPQCSLFVWPKRTSNPVHVWIANPVLLRPNLRLLRTLERAWSLDRNRPQAITPSYQYCHVSAQQWCCLRRTTSSAAYGL